MIGNLSEPEAWATGNAARGVDMSGKANHRRSHPKLIVGFALAGALAVVLWIVVNEWQGEPTPITTILLQERYGFCRLIVFFRGWVVYERTAAGLAEFDAEIIVWVWGSRVLAVVWGAAVGCLYGRLVCGLIGPATES